jgi:hypothetical protein
MKNALKTAVAGAVLALGVLQTQAAKTNEVHGSTFTITAWTQGATTTNGQNVVETVNKTRLGNKDFLTLLSGLTVSYQWGTNTIVVSNVAFTAKASLILKGPTNSTPLFYVRDFIGTNVVDYDISAYLSVAKSGASVKSGHLNLKTGDKGSTETEVLTLTFNNGKSSLTAFTLSGFTTITKVTVKDKLAGFQEVISAVTGDLAGTGTFEGDPAVVAGTFGVGNAKIEIK